MKLPLFVLTIASFSLPLLAAERPPNILLILPDQMRATAMGCAGNSEIQTPNIDQLAKEGMLFPRTYANVPVCCPARATMLTGTYAHKNGMVANDLRLREDQVTIAKILKEAGYRTGFIGKWHLDGGPREPGFVPPGPRRLGFDFWAAYQCHHRHFAPVYFRDTPEVIQVNKFEPEASCDFGVEFLKSQTTDKPFFLTIQMGPPHDPYGAPEDYMRRYDPEKITPPANWQAGSEVSKSPDLIRRPWVPERPAVPLGGKEEIAAYYAAITAMDEQVGRLMQTLKETGQDENTIVLFTSDHGDMLGSHGMRRKRKPHDESARVPGIVRWPGKVPANKVVETLFSHVDMAPTLLALAGQPVPAQMQGTDLSRVARGETTKGPEAVLLQIFVPMLGDQIPEGWRGIVTAQHTYARYETKPWVLFDHAKDPNEMHNLAEEAGSAALQRELDGKLAALMQKNGDNWGFNSSDLVEGGVLFKGPKTFYSIAEYQEFARTQGVPEAK